MASLNSVGAPIRRARPRRAGGRPPPAAPPPPTAAAAPAPRGRVLGASSWGSPFRFRVPAARRATNGPRPAHRPAASCRRAPTRRWPAAATAAWPPPGEQVDPEIHRGRRPPVRLHEHLQQRRAVALGGRLRAGSSPETAAATCGSGQAPWRVFTLGEAAKRARRPRTAPPRRHADPLPRRKRAPDVPVVGDRRRKFLNRAGPPAGSSA